MHAKIQIKILLIVMTLVFLAGCISLILERGFPEYSGIIRESGLINPVQIYRDDYGIPHIFAENQHDLYFAQGYVHAQDRLFQMETFRRLVRGRMAELAGRELVELDKFMHMLKAEETAKRLSLMTEPETGRILDAYIRGINAYVDSHRKKLPLEFSSLGLIPEPFNRKDAFSPVILISWFLNQNYSEEMLAVQALPKMPLHELVRLFPAYPEDFIHTRDDYLQEIRNWNIAPFIPAALAFKNLFRLFGGSNNWTVSGKHTQSGKPMIANDPHLVHTVPSLWYFCHLKAPGVHVAGASIPGAPGVVVGQTDSAAWAITNLMTDYVDLCLIETDPEDPYRYLWKGHYREMEKKEILLPVKDKEPERFTIYRTEAGPVLTEAGKGEVQVALKWPGDEADHTMDAFVRLNRAESAGDIMEAGRFMELVSINLAAADRKGNIAWHATGKVPVRKGYSGFWPVPANQNKELWEGFIPYDELPSAYNPSKGFIVTANEKRTGKEYPFSISFSWAAGYRAERIRSLLEQKFPVTSEDFSSIQNDVYSLRAESILSQINRFNPRSPKSRWARDVLKKWDREVKKDSRGAAVYEVFITKLIVNALEDDLGDALYYYFENLYKRCFLDNLTEIRNAAWWDQKNTPGIENYADILEISLGQTVDQLTERLGEDREEWSWGRLHQIYYRHPGADSWIFRQLINPGPFSMGGDNTTINVGGYNPFLGRFHMTVIPSMRMIVDLGNAAESKVIGSMGQSGQPEHSHYSDMVRLWRTGQYLPLYLSRQKIIKNRKELLVLRPE